MQDQSAVRRAYDQVAADYARLLPDTRAEQPEELALLDVFVELVGHAPLLDAGCGAGRITRYLADRGCVVTGMDLSPGMVITARHEHPDVPFVAGSLTSLPFPDHHFAGVLLWYSIIHTTPDEMPRVLGEAGRVLRPGGHLVVGFQSGSGTRDVSASYRAFGHDIELERQLHSTDAVSAALAPAGMRELDRFVRPARGAERDEQAFLLSRTKGW